MVVLWHFYLTRFHCGCYQHAACCLLCAALALGFKYLQSSCGESLTAAAWHWVLFLVVTWGWSVAENKREQLSGRIGLQVKKKLTWVKCAFVMDTRLITWNEMKIHLSLFRDCLNFRVRHVTTKNLSVTAPVWIIARLNLIGLGFLKNWIEFILRLCCEALDAQMIHISSKKTEIK